MGTVQATCLPAFKASIDIQAWSGMGELIWTASTLGVFEQVTVVGVAGLDSVAVAAFVQALAVAAADRVDFRAGVFLIDRDEFGPEA